jgi:N-acetylmuramoyl-L-alanine amidase
MAKKVYLSPSSQPANTYAVGNTNEQEQCRKIAASARDALIRCGFDVKAGMDGTMYTRVAESNRWGADAHIPIHTNAHNGKTAGFRGFYYKKNGEGHKLVSKIMDAVAPLTPGTADGVSAYPGLYEVEHSAGYCAYLELGFHDNAAEAQYIIDHTQELGEAICKGVCDYYGVEYATPESVPTQEEKPIESPVEAENTIYRVQVGAFRNKQYAYNMLEELRSHGYDGFVVPVNLK